MAESYKTTPEAMEKLYQAVRDAHGLYVVGLDAPMDSSSLAVRRVLLPRRALIRETIGPYFSFRRRQLLQEIRAKAGEYVGGDWTISKPDGADGETGLAVCGDAPQPQGDER